MRILIFFYILLLSSRAYCAPCDVAPYTGYISQPSSCLGVDVCVCEFDALGSDIVENGTLNCPSYPDGYGQFPIIGQYAGTGPWMLNWIATGIHPNYDQFNLMRCDNYSYSYAVQVAPYGLYYGYYNDSHTCIGTLKLDGILTSDYSQLIEVPYVPVPEDNLSACYSYYKIWKTESSCNSGRWHPNDNTPYRDTYICPIPPLYIKWWTELYNGALSFEGYWFMIDESGRYWYFNDGSYQKFVDGVWSPIEGLQGSDGIYSYEDFLKLPCNTPLRFVGNHQNFPDIDLISPTFTREEFSFVDFVDGDFPLQYNTYIYTEKYVSTPNGDGVVVTGYSIDVEAYQGNWGYFTGTEVFEKIGSTYQSIPPTEGDLSYYDVWDSPVPFTDRKFKFEIPIDSVSYSLGFNITDRCQPNVGYSGTGQLHKSNSKKESIRSHKGIGVYERRL